MSVPLPAIWQPTVEVDWGGTGTYAHPQSNVTADTAADPGLALDAGRDGSRALNPPKVPSLTFTLRNDQRHYSHENPNSPTYQLVTPGTPVRATLTYGSADRYTASGPYDAFDPYDGRAVLTFASGRLDDASEGTAWGEQLVRVSVLGQCSVLVGRAVTVPLQTNIRTDQAIALVLDAAGWPAGKRALSAGDTVLSYWWADERSAWDAIVELLASEGPGALYEDADGVLHFEGRNYRAVTARSTAAQAVFYDLATHSTASAYTEHDPYTAHDLYDGRASGYWFTNLAYEPGWRSVYARATYATKRRIAGTPASVVWQYGADIVLTASQSVTIYARPQNPFQAAIAPAVSTDYTVTAGSATVSLTYTSGFLAIIAITAGGSGATVRGPTATPTTGLQLRATPLTVQSETTVQSSLDTATSASTYKGIQTLAVSGWPEVDPATAAAVCDAWVTRYRVQRPTVTVTVRGADLRHGEQALLRQVSDRITLSDRQSGFSGDVWIESRQVVMSGAGGRILQAIWGCEPCEDTLTAFLWDASNAFWGLDVPFPPGDPNAARWAR